MPHRSDPADDYLRELADEPPGPSGPLRGRIPLWLWVLAMAATVASTVLALGFEPETKANAAQTYARNDSLIAFKARLTLQHQLDSLVWDARVALIYAKMAEQSTNVDELLNACKRRGECR